MHWWPGLSGVPETIHVVTLLTVVQVALLLLSVHGQPLPVHVLTPLTVLQFTLPPEPLGSEHELVGNVDTGIEQLASDGPFVQVQL